MASGETRCGVWGLYGAACRLASAATVNTLETILRRAQAELDGQGKKWTLVGGLAVVVRGEPRFTRDADLAIAVENDTEAESLVRGLQGQGYSVFATVEHQAR